jgi:hypothetical protein
MPTNRVPTAVISVESKIAAAMTAEPINTDTEVPEGPGRIGRCPRYSVCLFCVGNRVRLLRSLYFFDAIERFFFAIKGF